MAWPQRQRYCYPFKHLQLHTQQHSAISQQTWMFSNTAVEIANLTQLCVSLLGHSQFCVLYFSVQLWHITVEVAVWTHHDDMLEFQHQAPQVVRPQRQAAVHIEVTHSCGTLPLVPVTTIQPVTCHPISEALMLDFTDTGKVCVRHCDSMKWGSSSEPSRYIQSIIEFALLRLQSHS